MQKFSDHNYRYLYSVNHKGNVFNFVAVLTDNLSHDGENKYEDIYYNRLDCSGNTQNTSDAIVVSDEDIDETVLDTNDAIATRGKRVEQAIPNEQWTPPVKLDFPKEIKPAGMNLAAFTVKGSDADLEANTSSFYTYKQEFIVLSDDVHIFIFRPSTRNTLLVDRFCWNEDSMVLEHASEVRYMRSQNADVPASNKDAFGGCDMNGVAFIEPTWELVFDGQFDIRDFAVCIIPASNQTYIERWQFFITSGSNIYAYTIPRSRGVLFDYTGLPVTNELNSYTASPALKASAIYTAGQNLHRPDAILYFQQEGMSNPYGESNSVKRSGQVMLTCNDTYTTQSYAFCFDVNQYGVITGVSEDPTNSPSSMNLNCANMPFYGTALRFDGKHDQLFIPTDSDLSVTNNSGFTFEGWFNPAVLDAQDELMNLFFVKDIVLTIGGIDHSGDLGLSIDKQGYLHLDINSTRLCSSNRAMAEFGCWNSVALSIEAASSAITKLSLIINQASYSMSNLDWQIAGSVNIAVGETTDASCAFKGDLSGINFWLCSRYLSNIYHDLHYPISSSDSHITRLVVSVDLSEGQGNTIYNRGLDTAVNISTSVGVISGAVWITANSPSRFGMPVLFTDNRLMSIRGARLNGSDSLSGEALSVQTERRLSPLVSSDGFIHHYYQRTDNYLGVALFAPFVARASVKACWADVNEQTSKIAPQLVLTARTVGTLYDNIDVSISHNNGADELMIMFSSPTLNQVGADSVSVEEYYLNVPNRLDYVIAILNGEALLPTGSDLDENPPVNQCVYDYKANVIRQSGKGAYVWPNGEESPESLLFAAACAPNVKDPQNSIFPVDISYSRCMGQDARWVMDPLAPSLFFAGNRSAKTYVSANTSDALDITGDRTLECYVNFCEIDKKQAFVEYNHNDVQYAIGIDDDNCFYGIVGSEDKVCAQATQNLNKTNNLETDQWVHFAATYRSSYALALNNGVYVDCGHSKNIDAKSALTIETWVKPQITNGSDSAQDICAKWNQDTGENSWRFKIKGSGKVCFQVWDTQGDKFSVASSTILSPETEYHLSAVYMAAKTRNLLWFTDNAEVEVGLLSDSLPTSLTIEVWLNPGSQNNTNTIVANGRSSGQTDAIGIQIDSNNQIKICIENEVEATGVYIAEGSYHHLAVVLASSSSSTSATVYIDGLVATSSPIQISKAINPDEGTELGWVIGAEYHDNGSSLHGHYSGGMNSLRIWDIARTAEEILDLIDIHLTGNEEHLLGLWEMSKGEGSNSQDIDLGDGITVQSSIQNLVNQKSSTVSGGAYFTDMDIGRRFEVYINGVAEQQASYNFNDESTNYSDLQGRINNDIQLSSTHVTLGCNESNRRNHYVGLLDNTCLWKVGRLPTQISAYGQIDISTKLDNGSTAGAYNRLLALWTFDKGEGEKVPNITGSNAGTIKGISFTQDNESLQELYVPSTLGAKWAFYMNGQNLPLNNEFSTDYNYGYAGLLFGKSSSNSNHYLHAYLNEIRIWNTLRSQNDINNTQYISLSAKEDKLQGYWPCEDGSGIRINDRTGNTQQGTIYHAETTSVNDWVLPTTDGPLTEAVPVSEETPRAINISNGFISKKNTEYTLRYAPSSSEFDGGLRRTYMFISEDSGNKTLCLDAGLSMGETELAYIGQMQFDPELIGYIEGAPPMPSENLTVDSPSNPDKYVDSSNVVMQETLAEREFVSEHQTYSGATQFNIGRAYRQKLHAEADTPTPTGIFPQLLFANAEGDFSFGANINVDGSAEFDYTGGHMSSNKLTKTHSLSFSGGWEYNTYNIPGVNENELWVQAPRLYRGNNMAAAIVKSMTADLYAVKSARTGATISMSAMPSPDVEPDVNIIMFPMNPRYVKNGTLDGYVGFDLDNDYQDLDPSTAERGSYYKPKEAYKIKKESARLQAQWADTLQSTAVKSINGLLPQTWAKKMGARSMTSTYVWAADGGIYTETQEFMGSRRDVYGGTANLNGGLRISSQYDFVLGSALSTGRKWDLDGTFSFGVSEQSKGGTEEEITFSLEVDVGGEGFLNKHADMRPPQPLLINTGDSFDAWIMDLNSGAPITNTEFYNTLVSNGIINEKDINGDTYPDKYLILVDEPNQQWTWSGAGIAYKVETNAANASIALNTLGFTVVTEAVKGQYSTLYQTDACPGKVKSYRFSTFYQDPSRDNFDLLFDDTISEPIIDPGWLKNTNDPDAVALTMAKNSPSDVWRILHRVTYVSRVLPEQDDQNPNNEYAIGLDTKQQVTEPDIAIPDAISEGNNDLLIKLILGLNDTSEFITIDVNDENFFDNVIININTLVAKVEEADELTAEESSNLIEMWTYYFQGMFLGVDVSLTPIDSTEGNS